MDRTAYNVQNYDSYEADRNYEVSVEEYDDILYSQYSVHM